MPRAAGARRTVAASPRRSAATVVTPDPRASVAAVGAIARPALADGAAAAEAVAGAAVVVSAVVAGGGRGGKSDRARRGNAILIIWQSTIDNYVVNEATNDPRLS